MRFNQRLFAIAVKEFKQLARDRITFGMIVMIPLVQLLLFGYAINTHVREIPVAIVDLSESTAGRLIAHTAEATQVVKVVAHFHTTQEAQAALTAGQIRAALILPLDLPKRLVTGQPLGQWLIDGSDSVVSSALLSLQAMPLSELIPDPKAERHVTQPTFVMTLLYNPERRSAINIVPGLAGIILTMTMILFTSAAIVRERERGNMEMLINTPVRPLELMLGKIVPYVLIGFVQVAIVLGLGHWAFAVPIGGNVGSIFAITLPFIAASLTLGLILSTIAKTQLQAMQMTIFVLLPSILLSGFMFPYEAMPKPAQWIAECLPATHFIRLIRAVVLRDAQAHQITGDIYWLLLFTLGGLIIASMRFKKNLD